MSKRMYNFTEKPEERYNDWLYSNSPEITPKARNMVFKNLKPFERLDYWKQYKTTEAAASSMSTSQNHQMRWQFQQFDNTNNKSYDNKGEIVMTMAQYDTSDKQKNVKINLVPNRLSHFKNLYSTLSEFFIRYGYDCILYPNNKGEDNMIVEYIKRCLIQYNDANSTITDLADVFSVNPICSYVSEMCDNHCEIYKRRMPYTQNFKIST